MLADLRRLARSLSMKARFDKTTPQGLANRPARSIQKKAFYATTQGKALKIKMKTLYDKTTPQGLANRLARSIKQRDKLKERDSTSIAAGE